MSHERQFQLVLMMTRVVSNQASVTYNPQSRQSDNALLYCLPQLYAAKFNVRLGQMCCKTLTHRQLVALTLWPCNSAFHPFGVDK